MNYLYLIFFKQNNLLQNIVHLWIKMFDLVGIRFPTNNQEDFDPHCVTVLKSAEKCQASDART